MDLPAIRRLPAGEARLEHGLGVGSRAACNRRIDDLDARVLLFIDVEHGVEPFLLAAVGPPAEYLELAAGCTGCWRGGGFCGRRGGGGFCCGGGGGRRGGGGRFSRRCSGGRRGGGCGGRRGRRCGTTTGGQKHYYYCQEPKHLYPTRHWCPTFLGLTSVSLYTTKTGLETRSTSFPPTSIAIRHMRENTRRSEW